MTLNIRHGGGSRVPEILRYLGSSNADVLVITEFRTGASGSQLRNGLRELGYKHQRSATLEAKINSVLLAARNYINGTSLYPDFDDRQRIVGGLITGVTIYGVYFAIGERKRTLYDYLLLESPNWTERSAVLIGDFNTGRHHLDEVGATFKCPDQFGAITENGWFDAWRESHGSEARAASWVSSKGNGFRIDHAFVNREIRSRVIGCHYDHATRPKITDHSALFVDIQ